MGNKKIELDEDTARKLYKTASPELKVILEKNFDKKILSANIIDRICDFNDILEIVSELRGYKVNLEDEVPWNTSGTKTKNKISQNANAKIQLITEAYNEGTILDWKNKTQPKYYLWFERTAHTGWVLDGVRDHYCVAGLGSGSYFKDKSLAEDACNKFKEIWDEYLPE